MLFQKSAKITNRTKINLRKIFQFLKPNAKQKSSFRKLNSNRVKNSQMKNTKFLQRGDKSLSKI